MKFFQESALITFIVICLLSQVQGNCNREASAGQGKGSQETPEFLVQKYQEDVKPRLALKYGIPQVPLRSINVSKEQNNLGGKISPPYETYKRPAISRAIRKTFSYSKAAKSHETKSSYPEVNAKENINLNPSNQGVFRIQKIYCRQMKNIEFNSNGNSIENIHHICEARPLQTNNILFDASSTSFPANAAKDISLRRLDTSTPKGVKCRHVMNSELNEAGEIVDSVTKVCDPAPTTTSTTRKPIWRTTPKITTTTPRALVKVCRPVMNSFLNEAGEIIDSITTVCKMEETS